ncbi:MAG: RHS repeat-associated core domain-containing protein, partial [Actinobacteria bacterium]|nr:RHS repeat-associated core domain-containing protein [Actinomycetota bacterium]
TEIDHDQNGNVTDDGWRTMTWDLESRPLSIHFADHTGTNTYSYDGEGNRLVKHDDNGTTTTYLWDTWGGLAQLALERDGSGNPLRRYVYAGGPLSMSDGGGAIDHYYLTDAQGSVVNVTSALAATEMSLSYDPFGDSRTVTQSEGAPENLLRYTGQLLDTSTGLYDLRARMYDPGSGRMLQMDPLGAGGLGATSSYAYANDAPTTMQDPTGLFPWGELAQAALLVGTAALDVATDGAATPLLAEEIEAEVGGEALAAEGGGIDEQLAVAESHLSSIDAMTGPNRMMLDQITEAQQASRALTAGEQNFLLHETTKARLMAEGLSQEAAHAGALETHPLFANYAPEVIKAFPEYFNSNWRAYWGIE